MYEQNPDLCPLTIGRQAAVRMVRPDQYGALAVDDAIQVGAIAAAQALKKWEERGLVDTKGVGEARAKKGYALIAAYHAVRAWASAENALIRREGALTEASDDDLIREDAGLVEIEERQTVQRLISELEGIGCDTWSAVAAAILIDRVDAVTAGVGVGLNKHGMAEVVSALGMFFAERAVAVGIR